MTIEQAKRIVREKYPDATEDTEGVWIIAKEECWIISRLVFDNYDEAWIDLAQQIVNEQSQAQ